MISKEEFKQKFDTEFAKEKQIFKKVKRIEVVWFVVATLLILGISIPVGILSETIAEHWILLVLITIFLWFALAILPVFQIKDKLVKGFKHFDLSRIIKIILEEDVSYNAGGYVNEQYFKQSEFVAESFDEYHGEDLFSFKIKGHFKGEETTTDVTISDICAKKHISDMSGKDTSKTIFSGAFCMIKFKRPFKCNLDINSSKKARLAKLETESTEFNKQFKSQTDNQIEARLILSISFMEKLLEFQRHAKCKVGFAFRDKMLFMYMKKPLFETSKNDDRFNFELVEPIYDDLKLLQDITTEIENNRKVFKIWYWLLFVCMLQFF